MCYKNLVIDVLSYLGLFFKFCIFLGVFYFTCKETDI